MVELLRLLDEDNFGTKLFEPAAVRIKIALQGQNADDHWTKSVSIADIRRAQAELRIHFDSNG